MPRTVRSGACLRVRGTFFAFDRTHPPVRLALSNSSKSDQEVRQCKVNFYIYRLRTPARHTHVFIVDCLLLPCCLGLWGEANDVPIGHRVQVWAPGSTLPVARPHASTTSLLGTWKTFFFHAVECRALPILLPTIWRVAFLNRIEISRSGIHGPE